MSECTGLHEQSKIKTDKHINNINTTRLRTHFNCCTSSCRNRIRSTVLVVSPCCCIHIASLMLNSLQNLGNLINFKLFASFEFPILLLQLRFLVLEVRGQHLKSRLRLQLVLLRLAVLFLEVGDFVVDDLDVVV